MKTHLRWLPLALFSLSGPAIGAETHRFNPTHYFLTFSAAHEPVLRIKPGDRVETTSVDSNGQDATGQPVAPRYNALTGPFYVEGAEPGDTLVVHLEKVRLNSPRGFASTRMGDNAITPREFVRGAAGTKLYHWQYDHETMTGSTDVTPRLSRLRLPLRPFPGCVGVAPAHQESLSSLYAGDHGGNIDYNQLVEGTSLYFPVNVAGAYFFFGDGHAAQGDGEPNGGAIETTLAVTFRVEVRPKQKIPALRGETAEHYMAFGMGDPLDRAYQRATANMVNWLTQEFGLERQEAHVLIGTSARYDIASIVNDRGNTIVCRVSKQLLGQMLGREE